MPSVAELGHSSTAALTRALTGREVKSSVSNPEEWALKSLLTKTPPLREVGQAGTRADIHTHTHTHTHTLLQ